MLRIGMRTLNGKSRQTAVAAFVRMPEPPVYSVCDTLHLVPAQQFLS